MNSFEIECQLDEILLRLSSGVPEEYIMRNIGVSQDDWARFKIDHFQTLSPFPGVIAATKKNTPFIERRTFKPYIHHARKFVLAP